MSAVRAAQAQLMCHKLEFNTLASMLSGSPVAPQSSGTLGDDLDTPFSFQKAMLFHQL